MSLYECWHKTQNIEKVKLVGLVESRVASWIERDTVCCVDYSLYFINVSYLILLSTSGLGSHKSYFLSEMS